MSDNEPDRFTDEHAKSILARAIEIDARRAMMTAEDLRAIVAEIGVSQSSLDVAIREHAALASARRISAGHRAATVLAGIGVPLGVAAGALVSSGGWAISTLSIMALGLFASGGIVVFQGASGSLRSFHLKNLAFWSGVFAGGMAALAVLGSHVGISPAMIMAGWCLRGWVSSSVLGSAAVVAVRRSRKADGSDAGSGTLDAPVQTKERGWLRLAKRILDRVSRPLRFGIDLAT
jgi:hypothetical protein